MSEMTDEPKPLRCRKCHQDIKTVIAYVDHELYGLDADLETHYEWTGHHYSDASFDYELAEGYDLWYRCDNCRAEIGGKHIVDVARARARLSSMTLRSGSTTKAAA